jgi:hypothetical protein
MDRAQVALEDIQPQAMGSVLLEGQAFHQAERAPAVAPASVTDDDPAQFNALMRVLESCQQYEPDWATGGDGLDDHMKEVAVRKRRAVSRSFPGHDELRMVRRVFCSEHRVKVRLGARSEADVVERRDDLELLIWHGVSH